MSEKTQKTHKTIFGTTEKSNFILNMTQNQFNKFATIAFSIGFILIFIFSGIAEIISLQSITVENYDWRIIPSIALAITGLIGISIFIIALIKQTLSKKQIIASIIALIMFVCMYISYINAFTDVPDYSSFLGYRYGRYEGLMVYLSYLFIFLGAMSINRENSIKRIFDVIMVIATLQCIWSVLQFIPSFPDTYSNIPYLTYDPMVPSGSSGSPIFLAAFLSAALAIAISGSMYREKTKFSHLYTTIILPLSFLTVKTQTVIGFSSATIVIILCTASFMKNKNSKKLSPFPVILALIGFAAATLLMAVSGFNFYDGEILWQDGCKRLGAFGQYTNTLDVKFDIHNIKETYAYLWKKALDFIQKFPAVGLGPEGFIIPQLNIEDPSTKDAMVFDRPYNDYLFYAATLGTPFCISFIISLIYSAINGIKTSLKDKNWTIYVAFIITLVYIITAVINNSTATTAPFIWFMFGICCCSLEKEN